MGEGSNTHPLGPKFQSKISVYAGPGTNAMLNGSHNQQSSQFCIRMKCPTQISPATVLPRGLHIFTTLSPMTQMKLGDINILLI